MHVPSWYDRNVKSYCDSVIPGTLRYVSNTVPGSIAYDEGYEVTVSRCADELATCLTAYDHGDPARGLVFENAVDIGNSVWQADVLLRAT
jgi:hypothetical protein